MILIILYCHIIFNILCDFQTDLLKNLRVMIDTKSDYPPTTEFTISDPTFNNPNAKN